MFGDCWGPCVPAADQIEVTSTECTTPSETIKVYMSLKLDKVFFWDISLDSGTKTELDPALFSAYNNIGGMHKKNPTRGQYSPAYLEDPTMPIYGTHLIISTKDPTKLPALDTQRVYSFWYVLSTGNDNKNQGEEEQEPFNFIIDLYPTLSDMKDCGELPEVTYYAGISDVYDLNCMYSHTTTMNLNCVVTGAGAQIVMVQKINDSYNNASTTTGVLSDNSDLKKVDLSGRFSSKYGTWQVFFLSIAKCGIVQVKHPCGDSNEVVVQYQHHSATRQKVIEVSGDPRIITPQTRVRQDTQLNSNIFKVIPAPSSGQILTYCVIGFFDISIINNVYDDTLLAAGDGYLPTFQSQLYLKPNGLQRQTIVFDPTKKMCPGLHEIKIKVKLKFYNLSAPIITMLYYEKDYQNQCAVNQRLTQTRFQTFYDENPALFTQRVNQNFPFPHMWPYTTILLATEKYLFITALPFADCPGVSIGAQIIIAHDKNMMVVNNEHKGIVTFSNQHLVIDAFPLRFNVASELELRANAPIDFVGMYQIQLVFTDETDVFESCHVATFPRTISLYVDPPIDSPIPINVLPTTIDDAVNLLSIALPNQVLLKPKETKSVFFSPIVSAFAASDSAFATVNVVTVDPDIRTGIVFDFVGHMVRAGPFQAGSVGDHQVVLNFVDSLGQVRSLLRRVTVIYEDLQPVKLPDEEDEDESPEETKKPQNIFAPLPTFTVTQNGTVELDLQSILAENEIIIGTMGLEKIIHFNRQTNTIRLLRQAEKLKSGKYPVHLLVQDQIDKRITSIKILISIPEGKKQETKPKNDKEDPVEQPEQIIKPEPNEPEPKDPKVVEEDKLQLDIDLEKITPEDLSDIIAQRKIPANQQLDIYLAVIEAQHQRMVTIFEAENSDEIVEELKIAQPIVSARGKFKFVLQKDILGSKYLGKANNTQLKSIGRVSKLFAGEDGSIGGKQVGNSSDQGRRLQDDDEQATVMNFDKIVAFELRRGDEDSAAINDLQFNVTVDSLISDELDMSIQFSNSGKISIGSKPDVIVCEIRQAYFFSSVDGPEKAESKQQFKLMLQKQFTGDQTEQALVATYDAVEEAAKGFIVGNIIVTLFFAVSFKSMWYLLSVMQIVVLLRPYAAWPALLYQVNNLIQNAITLEPISQPIIDYGKSKFYIADDQNDDQFLDGTGVERKSVFADMGIFSILLILVAFFIVLYAIVKTCNCITRLACWMTLKEKLRMYLIFSAPIQYVISGYFRLVPIFLGRIIVAVDRGDQEWYFMMPYAIVLLFFFIWPLMILIHLLKNFELLDEPMFRQTYEKFYLGIHTSSPAALSYQAIFAIRRFVIILINFAFTTQSPILGNDRNNYQAKVILFLLLQTFQIAYIYCEQPHDDPFFNTLELVNEFALTVFGYAMLLFAGLGDPTAEAQLATGQVAIICVILFIYLINIVYMVQTTCYRALATARVMSVRKEKCLCLFRLCPYERRKSQKVKEMPTRTQSITIQDLDTDSIKKDQLEQLSDAEVIPGMPGLGLNIKSLGKQLNIELLNEAQEEESKQSSPSSSDSDEPFVETQSIELPHIQPNRFHLPSITRSRVLNHEMNSLSPVNEISELHNVPDPQPSRLIGTSSQRKPQKSAAGPMAVLLSSIISTDHVE